MSLKDNVLSVSEVNLRIKRIIDSDRSFSDIYVKGELSNYKVYPSGHHYFTLKDEGGVLKAVIFRSDASRLKFRPESGMKVVVRGRISVYERDGAYQIYAKEITPDGLGALYLAYEQLKAKLQKMGYFDSEHKKPIPKYPMKICLITSPAGAAVRDMLRILKKRWPICEVVIYPVRVQGEEAPGEIAAGIYYVNARVDCDLIITGRGGGSIEDLWAFNSELVADAVYNSKLPVISAVGHEPDYTIIDFVADLRAATPSNAAELAVPDATELGIRLSTMDAGMRSLALRHLHLARQRYQAVADRPVFVKKDTFFADRRQRLLVTEMSLNKSASHILERSKMRLVRTGEGLSAVSLRYIEARRAEIGRLSASLDAMSPLKVLSRGYSVAVKQDGSAVRSVTQLEKGERLKLRLSDGILPIRVEGGGSRKKSGSNITENLPEETQMSLQL